jgi:iron-sulfur cluster assembly protein
MKIAFTERALKRIEELYPSDKNALRISVEGGGCSGLKYVMEFISDFNVDDEQVRLIGATGTLVVDNKSALFLDGVTIDYDGSLNGKGFEFKNPRAKTTCGCGESFGV